MKYSLIPIIHKIKFRWEEYKFKSPIIYNFLKVEELLESGDLLEMIKVIDIIIPKNKIKTAIKAAYCLDIVEKIFNQIFPEDEVSWWSWSSSSFFAASLDFISWSESVIKFTKKTTISQLRTLSAAKERNMNIRNWKPELNNQILTRQLGKTEIEAAKDRIRLKLNAKKNGK